MKKTTKIIISILSGAVSSFLVFYFLFPPFFDSIPKNHFFSNELSFSIFSLFLMFLYLFLSIYLQLILHESGHLVFGIVTGYTFSSFRIGSFMLVKIKGKLCFKKMKLAGTAGQCLLIPPDIKKGTYPSRLYNLGGVFFNILFSFVGLFLYQILPFGNYLKPFFIAFAISGFILAFANGFPIKTGEITNDGYNALMIQKDKDAQYSFWLQLQINAMQVNGVRLKDMPEEWFKLPAPEKMKNTINSTIGVFAENRAMDSHNFERASELIEYLLSDQCELVGIYKNFLKLDKLYLELVTHNTTINYGIINEASMKTFLKQMKNFPNVIRTQYTLAVVAEKDFVKAQKLLGKFKKISKSYPSIADIESERELIEIAQNFKGNPQL